MRKCGMFGKVFFDKKTFTTKLARTIPITIFALVFLVFIFPVNDGFPVVVTVDASSNLGSLPDVLRPGLSGDWSAPVSPFSSQLAFDKRPFWRLSLGIGWDNSLYKSEDFDIQFRDWLRYTVDPNIKKYQNSGHQVVISINQMPKWLSLYQSDEFLPEADVELPKWQYSPPNNYDEWKKLLRLLVTTQKQDGINADYIIWDEPNWMFYGTEDQYFEMYKHSVEAIKGIDSSIKVGALGVGCWGCEKDSNCPFGACQDLGHSMIEGQIIYVSANNVPMDFIDWHFPDLNFFQAQVAATRFWLNNNQLDSALPLTIGEWVFSSQYDYESTEGGSANVIFTLKALIDNGIYRHTATSIYDQSIWLSGNWAHVGFFSSAGIIKAKWNAFKAIDKLSGQRLQVDAPPESFFTDGPNVTDGPTDGPNVTDSPLDVDTPLVTALASKNNNNISVVMANNSVAQAVTLQLNNVAPGFYTLSKYFIDGDMTDIHSNPCRYNKNTEPSASTSECGVDGALDKAVVRAKYEAEKSTAKFMMSAGISQNNVSSILGCISDPECVISDFLKVFCEGSSSQCSDKMPIILEANKLYNNLFHHGRHQIKSGRIYNTSTYIDQINNLKEVSLEGSKQVVDLGQISGTYEINLDLLPYSVVLIELQQ